MKNFKLFILLTVLLVACSSTKPVTDIVRVIVELPKSEEWELITDKGTVEIFFKEWEIQKENYENIYWVISEQTSYVNSDITPKKFMSNILELEGLFCEDIDTEGPTEINIHGHKTYSGNIVCAQKNETNYGYYKALRVIMSNDFSYVISSEIRVPFKKNLSSLQARQSQKNSFSKIVEESNSFIKESIHVCLSNGVNCI